MVVDNKNDYSYYATIVVYVSDIVLNIPFYARFCLFNYNMSSNKSVLKMSNNNSNINNSSSTKQVGRFSKHLVVSDAVYNFIKSRGKLGDTFDNVLRDIMGIPQDNN